MNKKIPLNDILRDAEEDLRCARLLHEGGSSDHELLIQCGDDLVAALLKSAATLKRRLKEMKS